jgi:hypothetical protein
MRLLAIVAASLLACSSNVTPETGPGGVTKQQACDDYSKAACDLFQRCLPLFVSSGFGDVATCYARTAKGCPAILDAPQTSANPNKISTCAGAFKVLSCEAISTSIPAACIPDPGGLADGAPCADDAQCKSTWCAKAGDSLCGKCTAQLTAGQACLTLTSPSGGVEKDCGRGLNCINDKCVAPVGSGGPCSDATSCALGLTCFGGKCILGGKPGAKCDPEGKTDPSCDLLQGSFCNPMTHVCQELAKASAGQACGLVGGEYKICIAGSTCITPPGAMSGTCIAPAIDGGACNKEKGPGCLEPAKCIDGVCKVPDPALCK